MRIYPPGIGLAERRVADDPPERHVQGSGNQLSQIPVHDGNPVFQTVRCRVADGQLGQYFLHFDPPKTNVWITRRKNERKDAAAGTQIEDRIPRTWLDKTGQEDRID